jgi:hypothetical protein
MHVKHTPNFIFRNHYLFKYKTDYLLNRYNSINSAYADIFVWNENVSNIKYSLDSSNKASVESYLLRLEFYSQNYLNFYANPKYNNFLNSDIDRVSLTNFLQSHHYRIERSIDYIKQKNIPEDRSLNFIYFIGIKYPGYYCPSFIFILFFACYSPAYNFNNFRDSLNVCDEIICNIDGYLDKLSVLCSILKIQFFIMRANSELPTTGLNFIQSSILLSRYSEKIKKKYTFEEKISTQSRNVCLALLFDFVRNDNDTKWNVKNDKFTRFKLQHPTTELTKQSLDFVIL